MPLTTHLITPGDRRWPDFVAALEQERLATDDLHVPGQIFLAFDDENGPVGYGGYAVTDAGALLRSIVIRHALRGRGLGDRLVRLLMERARSDGACRAWLLTLGSALFFQRMGFTATPRSEAPPAIADTPQFRGVCPGNATLMHRTLNL